jgi:hypothetical protein
MTTTLLPEDTSLVEKLHDLLRRRAAQAIDDVAYRRELRTMLQRPAR